MSYEKQKKSRIRIVQIFFAMFLVLLVQLPVEAKAATDVNKSFEEVVIVKTEDGTKCGNFGCIALDGKGGLYALKTDTESTPNYSILYYFKDYRNYKTTRSCKKYRVNQSLGHGNGMTYRDGKLYVAAGKKIMKMSTEGIVEKTYTLDMNGLSVGLDNTSISASSITYYKSDTYIVGIGKIVSGGEKKNIYVIGKFEGSQFKVTSSFIVNAGDGYKLNQDICYGKGCLYIVTSNNDVENKILCIKKFEGTVTPSQIITIEKPKQSMDNNALKGKFEAEGIAIESDGTILIGANCTTINDGVFISSN